jgi:uncharacterized membrane protein
MSATTSSLPWPSEAAHAVFSLGREPVKGPEGVVVDWVLRRTGSGTRESQGAGAGGWQPMAIYAVLCAVSLGLASLAWSRGSQVVMPLAWCGLMLVGCAMGAWARHASDMECIALRGDRLTVEHTSGSHVERVEFQSAWVRVEPEHGDRSLIELSGQGRRIAVGRYVRPEQRRLLAEELRLALRRWHQGALRPASM